MKINIMHSAAIATSLLMATGCANMPNIKLPAELKETFASEDPCSNNSRNIGIAAGAVMGAIFANATGNKSTESKIIGALIGSAVGGLIGADMDRKRCELAKVAKKYDLDIVFADVDTNGDVKELEIGSKEQSSPTQKVTSNVVGNTVTIRDKTGLNGQFESGSDKLTSRTEEYFNVIAIQYSPATVLDAQSDPRRKEEIGKQLAIRKILLIGHTDDTGSSKLNADLSERRARKVADFLKQKGVPESNIYYQGAGESFPISDNRTEEGRALNRRVEIVEVADDASFKKYLNIRKPQTAFYRSQTSTTSHDEKNISPTSVKTQVAKIPSLPNTSKVQKQNLPPAINNIAPIINFGGKPYSDVIAKIDTGLLQSEKSFGLISKAQADDNILKVDCSYDRPRVVGSVKSLKDDSPYKTTDYLPQLYGKTWASSVNDNLVVINNLTVLRGNGSPANLPELKVYSKYKPGNNKKPDVNEEPAVNSYLVEKGVLYRIFPKGDGGLKCMDLLFSVDGAKTAKEGKLIYVGGTNRFVANIRPEIQ